ncbi:class I mannose-6-phosphate isomerase [Faecalicatena sp. AGMB00832]|uniref:Class I mannose-6-phosphate isomerase n=1 Tax=Faecalicatena faecalis TaxID=2726362 RepID=A0ABS6DB71_9FIRM|nr:type I phosphomannose isomerase catalytic subunit [Faecalicatena faecalis]MBU3878706.1 class I mannose-6-phosphate isomerase [Faecalicatena faecalis]
MTKRNISYHSRPFLLSPAGKNYLWGGVRLREEFGKDTMRDVADECLAETWECSTHPDGPSIVASGEWKGKTLTDVLNEHPEYLGTHPEQTSGNGQLPILIKLIDAKENLSVQVHPDDTYAHAKEHGQQGKSEMWYVMDAKEDAKLVYGFYHDMDKDTLNSSLKDGTIEKYLQKVSIHKDDVFFIEAGTIHAIGAGALIAEIQENSNLTYRLYDYDRLDKNGCLRELHREKALDVINLKGSSEPRQPLRVLKYQKGSASELLCRCKYFQVERHLLNTERSREMVEFYTKKNSFHVFLCMEGCGVIFMEDGEFLNFFKGDCIFTPANSVNMRFHGKAELLGVHC